MSQSPEGALHGQASDVADSAKGEEGAFAANHAKGHALVHIAGCIGGQITDRVAP